MTTTLARACTNSFKLSTGATIPQIGLGTYNITTQEHIDEAVDAALEAGYRHFDTGYYYKNQKLLGLSLKKFMPKYGIKREDIFVGSKIFPSHMETKKARQCLDQCLSQLDIEYIDLMLIREPTS